MLYLLQSRLLLIISVFLFLTVFLVCINDLYAQIRPEEVDFEIIAVVIYNKDETLWNLAQKYYNNPYLWPYIGVMNNIQENSSILDGTAIYIPAIGGRKKPKIEEQFKKELKAKEDSIKNLLNLLDQAISEINDLKSKINAMEKNEVKQVNIDSDESIRRIREEIRELKDENESLKKALKEKDNQLRVIDNTFSNNMAELDKTSKERDILIEEKNKRITELESEIKDYKEKVIQLEKSLSLNIKNKLIEDGFENVYFAFLDGDMILAYENRIYRNEIKAMDKVINTVPATLHNYKNLGLITQNRGIPLLAVNIPSKEFSIEKGKGDIDFSMKVDETWQKTKLYERWNSGYFKFDIVFIPQFMALFKNRKEPIKSQINLTPIFNAYFWKGMSISNQLIIPLQNDFGEKGDYWRPGLLTINQTLRLPSNIFSSTTVGYFTENRYGIDLAARKYFANGRFFMGGSFGYTGYASYLKGVWSYSKIDLITGIMETGYQFPKYNLSLRGAYGKFLSRDKGFRFDLLQNFGEIGIGLFAFYTEVGKDGGIKLRIPMFPEKYLSAKRFRISTVRSLDFEWIYKGLREGIQYETGQSIDEFMERHNPIYFKNQMVKSEIMGQY